MDDQYRCVFRSLCQQVTQVGVMVVELVQLLGPGVVERIEGRVVPLSLTTDRVGIQVMAHHIYAVDVLNVCQALDLPGGHIPAGAAEGFCDGQLLAQLLRGGGELPGAHLVGGGEVAAQPVNAGNVLVFIDGHDTGAADHLAGDGVFFDTVAGELAVVLFTPAVDPAHESFAEQDIHQPPVTEAETFTALTVHEQGGQHIQGISAVGLGELGEDHGGVGGVPAEVLGLIGEEALDSFAEFLGKTIVVALVSFADEGIYDFGIQNVGHGGVGAVVNAVVFTCSVRRGGDPLQLSVVEGVDTQSLGVEGRLHLITDVMGPVFGIFQQQSAGEAAGPAVLVITPGIHAQLSGLIHRGFHGFKPFFLQVGRFQTATGMHEETAHAGFVHIPDLLAQMVGLQTVIPAPEGNALVIPQAFTVQPLKKLRLLFHN